MCFFIIRIKHTFQANMQCLLYIKQLKRTIALGTYAKVTRISNKVGQEMYLKRNVVWLLVWIGISSLM